MLCWTMNCYDFNINMADIYQGDLASTLQPSTSESAFMKLQWPFVLVSGFPANQKLHVTSLEYLGHSDSGI